ncbi:olfactory receptor 6B1-like [Haliaeetus albicilla]|uniref:olfactory receptor 6B1-like n=1 Tax=Haliaeetus albicilla TaxID=8969 RepID=UPI00053CD30C|nr:PREDICTED: olfactory receptor 6B1-like [Haliaeetus leucocephalus]
MFLLLGFPALADLHVLFSIVFLLTYILTVLKNMVIIALIKTNCELYKPMYFFLGHRSFIEVWYISVTIPKLLSNFIAEDRSISSVGCMTQLFFFSSFMCTECVLLSAMVYDCYVAVCQPLHYPVLMTYEMCIYLVAVSWFSRFIVSLIKISFISQLKFCGPHVINHFFSDISPVLNLACTDMSLAEMVDFVLALFILLISFFITLVSYLLIFMTILRIPNTQSKKKALSTCSSHLTVATIFFSATLFMYARPKKIDPFDLNELVSAVYTIVTPILNPFIYCLRNQEVKRALKKTLCENNCYL